MAKIMDRTKIMDRISKIAGEMAKGAVLGGGAVAGSKLIGQYRKNSNGPMMGGATNAGLLGGASREAAMSSAGKAIMKGATMGAAGSAMKKAANSLPKGYKFGK